MYFPWSLKPPTVERQTTATVAKSAVTVCSAWTRSHNKVHSRSDRDATVYWRDDATLLRPCGPL